MISLAMSLIKVYDGTYKLGDSSLFVYDVWGLITLIVLFSAIFKIKGAIKLHPHLSESQNMMKVHLILFGLNEVVSLSQLIIPLILIYADKKNAAEITNLSFLIAG